MKKIKVKNSFKIKTVKIECCNNCIFNYFDYRYGYDFRDYNCTHPDGPNFSDEWTD